VLLPKELRDMLLRCCKDELWGSPKRLLGAATPAFREKTRQDLEALKRSLHNDVSGKVTRGCIEAAWAAGEDVTVGPVRLFFGTLRGPVQQR
jgi:hypothetical protein